MVTRSLAPALALVTGCCSVPWGETFRPEMLVTTAGAGAVDRVVVCTWSSWRPLSPGCDDVAVGVSVGEGWRVPAWASHYVTVIAGEAPLDDSVVVACAGTTPLGATFLPWDVPRPDVWTITVPLDGLGGVDWSHDDNRRDDAPALVTLAPKLCAGDPSALIAR